VFWVPNRIRENRVPTRYTTFPLKKLIYIYIYCGIRITQPPAASGVARGLSQGEQNLPEWGSLATVAGTLANTQREVKKL